MVGSVTQRVMIMLPAVASLLLIMSSTEATLTRFYQILLGYPRFPSDALRLIKAIRMLPDDTTVANVPYGSKNVFSYVRCYIVPLLPNHRQGK